jgi:putative methionine-R-sulfoxide reductase with GAF domain
MKKALENLTRVLIFLTAIAMAASIFVLPSHSWWQPALFASTFIVVGGYLLLGSMAGTIFLIFSTVLYVLAIFKSISGEAQMVPVIAGLLILYVSFFIVKKLGDTSAFMLSSTQDQLKGLEGDYAAMIIEKKNLVTGMEANSAKLEKYVKLKEIYDSLSSQTDFSSKMRHVLRNVIDIFHQEKSISLFLTRSDKVMKIMADKKDDLLTGEPDVESLYLKNFDEFILHNKKSIIITDMDKEIRFKSDGEDNIRSLISVPVFVKDAVVGILRVNSDQPGCFNQEDLRFLDIIGSMLARVLAEEKYV